MKRKVIRKKKPAGAKPVRKRAPIAARSRAIRPKQDFIDELMTAGAQALGLSIDPAWRNGVKFNLRLVLSHAERVDAFALPDDAEPAPVFHA